MSLENFKKNIKKAAQIGVFTALGSASVSGQNIENKISNNENLTKKEISLEKENVENKSLVESQNEIQFLKNKIDTEINNFNKLRQPIGLDSLDDIPSLEIKKNKLDSLEEELGILNEDRYFNSSERKELVEKSTPEKPYFLFYDVKGEFIIKKEKDNPETTERYVKKLAEDPAIKIIFELGFNKKLPELLKSKNLSNRQISEHLLHVSRSLHENDIPISIDNFNLVLEKILELRTNKEVLDVSLFKNRNVLILAHNEILGQFSNHDISLNFPRFGVPLVNKSILDQNPKSFNFFSLNKEHIHKMTNTKEVEFFLNQFRENFLNNISETKELTLVFNGHGSPNDLVFAFSPRDPENPYHYNENYITSINYKEISIALKKRYVENIKDQPIIILASCFNHNFIRNLISEIKKINKEESLEIPLPVFMGNTEFMQESTTYYGPDYLNFRKDKSHKFANPSFFMKKGYSNLFFEGLLKNKKDTKIEDVLKIENSSFENNISIFFPLKENPVDQNSKKELIFQIGENQNFQNEDANSTNKT